MTIPNWMELGLSEDEEKIVREGAALYKATYLDTIDNVFKIAEAIDILQARHYGSGVQGGFADALVQYGFSARDGSSPLDKGIRSNLKELRRNEKDVRGWWGGVPENKKRDWLSARAIYRHWKRWKASKSPKPDNIEAKFRPVEMERAVASILHHLEAITDADHKQSIIERITGPLVTEGTLADRVTPDDSAEDIADVLVRMFKRGKAKDIFTRGLAKLGDRNAIYEVATGRKPFDDHSDVIPKENLTIEFGAGVNTKPKRRRK